MAMASFYNLSTRFSLHSHTQNNLYHNTHSSSLPTVTIITRHGALILFTALNRSVPIPIFAPTPLLHCPTTAIFSAGNGGGALGSGGGGGAGGGGNEGGEEEERDRNREDALLVLSEAGRPLETLPADLVAAIEAGRVPGSILRRFFELEKSVVFRWLLNFGGFKQRLLADDLFLAKLTMECGVVIFTKAAAEWERRKEKFIKELDFVVANVVTGIVTGFVLVWFPAPTVSLKPPLAVSAGPIAKFFYGCPENAFQVALAGTSYTLLQRIGAIVRNGVKLFAVGTGASLVGISITNALINAQKVVNKFFAAEAEDLPVLSTSIAYGIYMVICSNLRYQVLAGIIEQRILEPWLHQNKLLLSAAYFAVGGLCSMGWSAEDKGLTMIMHILSRDQLGQSMGIAISGGLVENNTRSSSFIANSRCHMKLCHFFLSYNCDNAFHCVSICIEIKLKRKEVLWPSLSLPALSFSSHFTILCFCYIFNNPLIIYHITIKFDAILEQ